MDRQASRPLAAVAVVTAATVWIAISIAAGFPARWEIIFQTLVAALTLTMVFVIQHTQARHQRTKPGMRARADRPPRDPGASTSPA